MPIPSGPHRGSDRSRLFRLLAAGTVAPLAGLMGFGIEAYQACASASLLLRGAAVWPTTLGPPLALLVLLAHRRLEPAERRRYRGFLVLPALSLVLALAVPVAVQLRAGACP